MKNPIFILLLCALGGCAGYSYVHGTIKGSGTYNYNGIPVYGNIEIDTRSCIGSCPSIKNMETINESAGSPVNTAK